MVKYAKAEEKPWDPIQKNTISALAAPPAVGPPASSEAEPAPELNPEPEEEAPNTPKKPAPKGSLLENPLKQPAVGGERLTRVVKCLFTPSEEAELRKLVGRLAEEAHTSLSLSHLIRPYFDLLLHCEEQLTQELGRAALARPLNDKTALAHFERQLAEVIHAAIRKAPPLRAGHQDTEA